MKISITNIRRKQELKELFFILSYLLVGVVLCQILNYVSEKSDSYLLNSATLRIDVIFIVYAVVGMGIICFWGQYKVWGYLLLLVKSIENMRDESETLIHMPNELKNIEDEINACKIEGIIKSNKVKNASLRQQKMMMYLAHDIRTPLTSILGYLNILSEENELPENQRKKYTGVALKNAEKLQILIDELFEMSQYESGNKQIEKQRINLKTMIEQLSDEFYPNLADKEMRIENHVDEIIIEAAPDLFGRAIGNLIKNAVIYGMPQTNISISAYQNEINTELIIKNVGKEIPSEYLNSIFEEFDRGAERNSSGTGLGLPIAQGIIKLHEGNIVARSLGNETSFVVTIPN